MTCWNFYHCLYLQRPDTLSGMIDLKLLLKDYAIIVIEGKTMEDERERGERKGKSLSLWSCIMKNKLKNFLIDRKREGWRKRGNDEAREANRERRKGRWGRGREGEKGRTSIHWFNPQMVTVKTKSKPGIMSFLHVSHVCTGPKAFRSISAFPVALARGWTEVEQLGPKLKPNGVSVLQVAF